MRLVSFLFVFLLFAFPGSAQTNSSAASESPSSNVASLEIPSNAVLLAELVTPIDARQLKPGDLIEAQVVKDLKSGKQVLVKGGTRLQGHVVSVQAPSSTGVDTVLSILFDRARTKSGELFATQLTLQALAPAPDIQGNSDSLMEGRGLADNHIKAVTGNTKDNTMTGKVPRLTESSRGVYSFRGMKLAMETRPDGVASMIVWSTGDPVLKKGTQMGFLLAH